MTRTARELHVAALDVLLNRRMSETVRSRDWELLRHVATMAASDAPVVLASTDPALFVTWRAAVTSFHLRGWSRMTPDRVDEVRLRHDAVEVRGTKA
jgi:predicted ATPase